MKSNNCYASKKKLTFDQIKEEELLITTNDKQHIVLAERIMVGAFDVSNTEYVCIEPFNSLSYGIKATAKQSIELLHLSNLRHLVFENPFVSSDLNPVEELLSPYIDNAKNLTTIEIFHSVRYNKAGQVSSNNRIAKELCSYLETLTVDNKPRFEKKEGGVIPKEDFNRRFYKSDGKEEIRSNYYQTTTFNTINNPPINDRCCSHG